LKKNYDVKLNSSCCTMASSLGWQVVPGNENANNNDLSKNMPEILQTNIFETSNINSLKMC